jgi:cell division initiation protein
MSLSSESIQKKEFHIVFKGYKPEEVDKFLDLLALEFDGMQKKIRDMEEKIDSIKYEGDGETSKMKKVIQEALVSAHRMAEEIKQKAKVEAEEIVSKKKMQEEQRLQKLQDEKTSLESSISSLRKEYADFKEQISSFADDFKQRMATVGDGKLLDELGGTKPENNSHSPEKPPTSQIEPEPEKKPPAKEDRMKDDDVEEEVLYKHASKESSQDDLGESDLKDLAALTDEMLERLDSEEEKTPGLSEEKKPRPKNKKDTEEEKRNRKKIDIANPDIINDFFKTDEE